MKKSIIIRLLGPWNSYTSTNPQFLLENLIECDFVDTLYVDAVPNKINGNYAKIELELSNHWDRMNEFEVYQYLKKGRHEGIKFIGIELYFK